MPSSRTPLPSSADKLQQMAASFRLPTLAQELVPRLVQAGHSHVLDDLAEIFALEADDRSERRVGRLLKDADLPPGKTFDTLDLKRFPAKLVHRLKELATGAFADNAENILCFGLPGVGKTHAAAAIGYRLVEQGRRVLYAPTFRLVQNLLAAKRDLCLPRLLHKLDRFEVLILDDIGYVQQSAEEIEVLFTLLAERYERRSMIITSNLVFSQWDQVFKNPLTTAAAIDRVVHHAVILEFNVASYQSKQARERIGLPDPQAPTETSQANAS
jgi:DNA replication protein DnaC